MKGSQEPSRGKIGSTSPAIASSAAAARRGAWTVFSAPGDTLGAEVFLPSMISRPLGICDFRVSHQCCYLPGTIKILVSDERMGKDASRSQDPLKCLRARSRVTDAGKCHSCPWGSCLSRNSVQLQDNVLILMPEGTEQPPSAEAPPSEVLCRVRRGPGSGHMPQMSSALWAEGKCI